MSSMSFHHFNKPLKYLWSKKIQVPALSHLKLLCEYFHKQDHQEGNSGFFLNPSWHCVLLSTLVFQWILSCKYSIGNNQQLLKSKITWMFFFFFQWELPVIMLSFILWSFGSVVVSSPCWAYRVLYVAVMMWLFITMCLRQMKAPLC